MTNTREKLIELLYGIQSVGACRKPSEFDDRYWTLGSRSNEEVADYLIANGVTVQKWYPRTEPPKKNGHYLCRYIFNDHDDMQFEQVISYYATDEKPHFRNEGDELGMKVTHWMPLPEPPKGE